MEVNGKHYQSVAFNEAEGVAELINQQIIPFEFRILQIKTIEEITDAIINMTVRGAPAIGMAAAYGVVLAVIQYRNDPEKINEKCNILRSCRPTAVNLGKGVDAVLQVVFKDNGSFLPEAAIAAARMFCENEVRACQTIGRNGLTLLSQMYGEKKATLNILTHCNAGWLACGDWGTALSPVFMAKRQGIPVHVWVDETRPRNQGASLTAWELYNEKIPFTIIPDNSGGLLMQQKQVDMVITGADRIAANGDTANKTGTYLKALAAAGNHIPFYVAAPLSTFDFSLNEGISSIPIEIRNSREVSFVKSFDGNTVQEVRIIPEEFPVINHAFDITPAKLITGFITERGVFTSGQLKQLI